MINRIKFYDVDVFVNTAPNNAKVRVKCIRYLER